MPTNNSDRIRDMKMKLAAHQKDIVQKMVNMDSEAKAVVRLIAFIY